VLTDLVFILRQYIKENNGDCLVLPAPLDIRLDAEKDDIVQPDVMIICDKSKFTEQGVVGAPDFVAEILSPSTRNKDASVKLTKYKQAGVREYWLIDPMNQSVQTFTFGEINKLDFYSFKDDIPVAIYDGKCKVNFSNTAELIENIYPKK